MNDVLLHVVRQEQDAIGAEFAARLPEDSPHRSESPATDGCPRLLAVLLAHWQNGDRLPARRWAQGIAAAAAQQGWDGGQVLNDLDVLAGAIRARLEGKCGDEAALLAAVDELDAGLGLLRREILAAFVSGREGRAEGQRSLLAAMLDHQPEAFLLATLEGKPFYINQAGRDLLGLPAAQEAAALKLRDLHAEQTWNELRTAGFPALKQSGVWRAQGQLRHAASGEPIDVDMTWQIVRPTGGKPQCLAVCFRDLRQLMQRDQALRESEARKAAIVESSLDPIITMDHEGQIIEFNRAAEKTFGRKRETVLGQELAKVLFSSSESASYQDRIDRYLGAGAGSLIGNRTEVNAVRANGEEFPIEMAMTMGHVQARPVCTFYLRDISESRKAQTALRDSEALYHSLVEHLPVAIYRKDLRGSFTFGNASYCAELGLKPASIRGKTDFDFFPKAQAFKYRDDDRHVIETGDVFEAVEDHFRPDGEKRYVHVLKTPVRDSYGKIVGTQGLFWDVTPRIRAEQALRESEQRLQSVLDNTTAVVYLKNREGQYLLVNRCFERLFEISSDRIVGKTDFDVFPHDLAEKFRANDRKVIEADEPIEFEEQAPHPDGLHTYISVKVPLRDETGEPFGICGISTDITSRKRAEDEFKRLSAFLDSILENLPIMLFVKDAKELRFERLNRAGEELLGLQHEQLLGKNDFDLFPQEQAEFYVAKDREVLASRALADIREEALSTRHGERIVHTRKIPILDEHGSPTHLVGVSEDITDLKRAEAELRSAKDAAEAANRAKSAFLANMSHEIRTPLTGVIGMADLLMDTSLAPQQREYCQLIRNSGNALLAVIGDVLDFSKIEAGKLELDHHPFRIRDGLGDTMKTMALRARSKNLELVCHIHSDVPEWLLGDATRLRQIVVNLVGNALKFTSQGEIVLTVEMESLGEERATLHFTVADTGIGIPEEKQQLIFQPFEQADTSTTRKYGGTGLGLTITARLVELMGGRLWLESEVGRGSRFHFTATLDLPAEDMVEPTPAEPIQLHGLPVLIVDDNATNRRLLIELLAKWQMQPTAVEGGNEALVALESALAAGRPYPLVLLDAQMPQLDGFCLAELIQQRPELVQGSIMMLTSGDQPGDIERCHRLGIAAYLTKPIKQSELFDAILNVVGAASASPALAAAVPTAIESGPMLRILVVEDSPVNQTLILAVLEKRGHQAVLAENGREALSAYDREPFDLILMDVQMPEMDGFEATASIRRREQAIGVHTPIIAMTAHAIKGDRERCLAAGMDSYLSKPVHPLELFATIRQLVRAPTVLERQASLAADAATNLPLFPEVSHSQKANAEPAAVVAVRANDSLIDGPARAEATALDASPAVNAESSVALVNGGLVHGEELLRRLSGDREAVRLLARTFIQEIHNLLPEMRRAIAERDVPLLRRAAHTLKGSAGIFAAGQVADAALRVESIAKTGNLDGIDEPFDRLLTLTEQLLPELAQLSEAMNG